MSFNYLSPKAETRRSRIEGWGSFATAPIAKDELIAVFGGYVMDRRTWSDLPQEIQPLSIQISDDLMLGPRAQNELGDGDFFNHSCDPNAGLSGPICLFARRPIACGEEITLDYATTMSGSIPCRFSCHCGASQCRGTITSDDWRQKELQDRYHGYFAPYLEEKLPPR